MQESATIRLDLQKLENDLAKQNLESSAKNNSKTQLLFSSDPDTYTFVCFSVMFALCEKRFYFEKDDFVIKNSKYVNIISNLVKNLRNSRKVTPKQIEIIDNDSYLKNIIMDLILDLGIMEENKGKLRANVSKMESHISIVMKSGKEVTSIYSSCINRILSNSLFPIF
jgi:hypothetical protein